MITIKIDNGKTYTVAREKMGVYHKLQQFINVGYLEEVKENKNSLSDKQDQSEVKIGSIDHKFTPGQEELMCDFKEAEDRTKEKLATYIKENRNTITLVQIEDFISSL